MLRPKNGRVTIRAMGDEKVTLSGADVIEGWKREAEGSWSAPLELEPRKVLRDGELWSQVTYDRSAKRLIVRKGDPRLHLYETVVREQGIDLNGKKNVRVEGITVENTLK
jgi:hypothetical protein